MNSKIRNLLFIGAVIFQVAILVSFLAKKDIAIRKGRKIIVKTVPVDPRSLFRGDYITLNYEFSRIDLTKVEYDKKYFTRGTRIYVKLIEADATWEAAKVAHRRFTDLSEDEVMITGTVQNYPRNDTFGVTYGIEAYFVPEGEGKYIEKEVEKETVTVELAIDKYGYAAVTKILINNKEVKFR